jgi:lysophospholipase L1-like esterase
MAITSIKRDWGPSLSIVRIVTNDTMGTVFTAGYLTAQAQNIYNINSGAFEWSLSDFVLIEYNTGWSFATLNSTFTTLTPSSGGGGSGTVTSITAGANLTGGTITGDGTIGLSDNPTVTSITTQNLTASNFTQGYAPLLPNPYNFDIFFFGDSITFGSGAGSVAKRWTYLVCQALGATEQNFGVPGDQWADAAAHVYNNFSPGYPAFLSYGTNDINAQVYFQHISRIVDSLVAYCNLTILGRNINARDGSVSKTGTWINNSLYTYIGVTTTDATPTLTATVNGRYILASFTIKNDATITSCYTLTTTIDSVVQNTAVPLDNYLTTTANGSSTAVALYFFDTGTAGTHTVEFSFAPIGSYTSPIGVDWIGAMDEDISGSPVYLQCPPDNGLCQSNINSPNLTDTINNIYRDTARKWRTVLKQPIYFDFNIGKFGEIGMLINDLTHPNPSGYAWMANRVLNFLTKGEVEDFIS